MAGISTTAKTSNRKNTEMTSIIAGVPVTARMSAKAGAPGSNSRNANNNRAGRQKRLGCQK